MRLEFLWLHLAIRNFWTLSEFISVQHFRFQDVDVQARYLKMDMAARAPQNQLALKDRSRQMVKIAYKHSFCYVLHNHPGATASPQYPLRRRRSRFLTCITCNPSLQISEVLTAQTQAIEQSKVVHVRNSMGRIVDGRNTDVKPTIPQRRQ